MAAVTIHSISLHKNNVTAASAMEGLFLLERHGLVQLDSPSDGDMYHQ